jgi:hypothetical protein
MLAADVVITGPKPATDYEILFTKSNLVYINPRFVQSIPEIL